ncbi:NAD(P)H-dependent flavin oxidoreductase [Sandaracinobacter sp.]|uniref:NAD(P)H-dependent flavin oxidoreductase n=1 Tax=Sandaracinobacter sp. TaxID=2487581 RepID=UPI0035B201C1
MTRMHPITAKLKARMQLPLIGSPLFIISNPDLVIAQCKAGVIGSFPSLNARPLPQFEEWLQRLSTELGPDDAPYAVNLIVHKSTDRLMADLELVVKYKVPVIITSLGAREDVNEAIHSYGGVVLHDVINNKFAKKAIEKGADGIIAVAAGAGGHAGTLSPFALISEIREWFDGPLALSGAMGTGAAILAAEAVGADFGYMGSAFIATTEARADERYKQAIVEGSASDIVYSDLFTGVSGNYLRPSIVAAGLDPDNLPKGDYSTMNFGSGGNTDAKAWRDIWGSGQGIGAVKSVLPAAEMIGRLKREYAAARARLLGDGAAAIAAE